MLKKWKNQVLFNEEIKQINDEFELTIVNTTSDIFTKRELYNKIIIRIEKILNLIKSENYSPNMQNIKSLFDHIIQYREQVIVENSDIVKTLNILTNALQIKFFNFKENLTPLFILCCVKSIDDQEIQTAASIFFEIFLSDNEFSFDSFGHELFQAYFNQFFPICKNIEVIKWSLHLIIDVPSQNSFSTENTHLLFQTIHKCITNNKLEQEIIDILFDCTANLFYKLSFVCKSCSQDFLKTKIPHLIDEKISPKLWQGTFHTLISANSDINGHPPNSAICNFLSKKCKLNSEYQQKSFFLIRSVKNYEKINHYFPITNFFGEYSQPIHELLNFLEEVSNDYVEIMPKLLQKMFKIFTTRMIDEDSKYKQLFSIVIRFNDSFNFDERPVKFLQCFILTPSPQTLFSLFKDKVFTSLILHYFSLQKSKEVQPQVFRALLEIANNRNEIIVMLLKGAPTKGNIRCLMNFIVENEANYCFAILLSSFIECKEVTIKFITCDGLQFIEYCFSQKLLTIDLYSMLIASLVTYQQFPEIDKFISRLDKNHPLFSISQKQLENVIFGMNGAKYRPMRVPSLFYYLQEKDCIDPYNSFLLGRYAMKQFLRHDVDIYEIPFITEISNRYLLPKHVDLMMKSPNNFDKFCDQENFDHFPLFILYPFQQDLIFEFDFKAISFWVKFDHSSSNVSQFCQVGKTVSFSIQNDLIIIDIIMNSNNSSSMKQIKFTVTNENKWTNFIVLFNEYKKSMINLILIVNGEMRFNNNIIVSFNYNGNTHTMKPFNPLNLIRFHNYGQHLMYIGPSIRFFSKAIVNSEIFAHKLYKMGPSYVKLFDNEQLITPFNLVKKRDIVKREIPPNCYPVPYFGFPFHFNSNRRMSDMFLILNSSKDKTSFHSVFNAVISINTIMELHSKLFFRQLLNSMKSCKQYVSKNIFLKALKSVSSKQPSSMVLTSILFDRELWKRVDVNILLEVIFDDYFKLSDFSKIQDFELFLATIARKHPESICILLHNLHKIPKLNMIFLNTLNYQKKKLNVQLAIVDGYTQIIHTNSSINITYIMKNIKDTFLIAERPLASRIFHLIVEISKKKNEPLTVTNSLLYTLIPLASFESIWIDISELINTFGFKLYYPLLLGLVWSYSFSQLSYITFSNNKCYCGTSKCSCINSCIKSKEIEFYYKKAIYALTENTGELINDKTSNFLLINLFPALFNIPAFIKHIGHNKSISDLIDSTLNGYGIEYQTPLENNSDATAKYFQSSLLVPLFLEIIKHCNQVQKFRSLYFSLFVGTPFFDFSLYSKIVPHFLLQFLKDYSQFECSQQFFYSLLFPISKNVFSCEQLESILELLFSICEIEEKNYDVINRILFVIYTINPEDKVFRNHIFQLLEHHIRIFYVIITSQRCEIAWFSILSLQQNILKKLNNGFKWGTIESMLLRQLISSKFDTKPFEIAYQNQQQQLTNLITAVSRQFHNSDANFNESIKLFTLEIENSIKTSKENSEKTRKLLQNDKLLLSKSFLIIEERMQWSHFISSLSDQMADVLQYNPKNYYLSPKCFPYHCPQRLSPSIFSGKEEVMELFRENTTSFFEIVDVRIFLKSALLPEDQVRIVDCKICRYSLDIPSVMFLHKSSALFITYAELASPDTIRLLKNDNHKFIESVLLGHWGKTSIFSSHIVLKSSFSHLIFLQVSMKKAFNIWSFRQGHYIIKMEMKKLIQVLYSISNTAKIMMDTFSPYQFLHKIEDSNVAITKWCKHEISTDDLLLTINGLNRKLFVHLKDYPYFPYVFDNQFCNYSVVAASKETATILGKVVPFSYYSVTRRKKINSFFSSDQSCDEESISSAELFNPQYNKHSISPKTNRNRKRRNVRERKRKKKKESASNLNLSMVNEIVSPPFASTDNLSVFSKKDSTNLIQFESLEHLESPECIEDFDNIEMAEPFPSLSQQKQVTSAVRFRGYLMNDPDESPQILEPVIGTTRHKSRRFSDAPSKFLINSAIHSQSPNNQTYFYRVTSNSEILTETISIEQLESILKQYSNPTKQLSPYRGVCPANLFYSPEFIKGLAKNPFVCVQEHRKAIEDPRNAQFILDWLKKYVSVDVINKKIPQDQFTIKHISSLDLIQVSQKLRKGCKSSKTFIFTKNKIKRIKRLSVKIFGSHYAVIDRKALSLSILDINTRKEKRLDYDKFYAFSRSLCISKNGLFLSVDFEFGVTRIYRIFYQRELPNSIELISDFSCNSSPISTISGFHMLCATASLNQLIIWEIFSSTIHRLFTFDHKITALSMDEEYGVWVSTEDHGYFISINGEILGKIKLKEEISQIEAITLHSAVLERAAICGTTSGKVYLLSPRFDTKTIDFKELKGGHSHEIEQIKKNSNNKMFITIDSKFNAVMWTAHRNKCEQPLLLNMFDTCALCSHRPKLYCSSCSRAICKSCSINGFCSTCYAFDTY
ncbi:hypothetical protein TRFO_39396 [Tritrichomonas foetus]|uniref:BEACH domain-containing protein n=1 Tax=Tritrichomonas foetus TaxID=1144522 RepID=A0A1J4J547_9EUKA|nr:hypothetical protein TRFO_39396 [Tritrichomonas foetus]|eukprot:OHS94410.1 hypothetical protein TRFO_39396 [Tritrichomonas foetus]